MMKRLLLLSAPLVVFALPLAHAGNNPYDSFIDPSFAPTAAVPGWTRVYIAGTQDEKGIAFARTPDGGYVTLISVPGGAVGSQIGLVRYGRNGTRLASGFGINGKVVKDAYLQQPSGMMVDHLGRIVVIGTTPGPGGVSDFGVVRFHTDGSDDVSFGGDGGIAIGMEPLFDASDDRPVAIVEQPLTVGYRLVIAGNTLMELPSGPLQRFGLIGLRDDGSVDPDFGNYADPQYDGRVNDTFALDKSAYASSLLVLADGHLVIGGTSVYGDTDTDFGACYLSTNGAPYSDFTSCITFGIDEPGPGGSLYDSVNGMVLSRNDSVVLAGTASGRIAAARLTIDGSTLGVDTSFTGSEIAGRPYRFVSASTDTYGNDVAVRDDGSIVIAGRSVSGAAQQGAVQRLRVDGSPDSNFAFQGYVAYAAPLTSGTGYSSYLEWNKVLIDENRPVLFGSSPDNASTLTDFDGVLARLQSDLIFTDSLE